MPMPRSSSVFASPSFFPESPVWTPAQSGPTCDRSLCWAHAECLSRSRQLNAGIYCDDHRFPSNDLLAIGLCFGQSAPHECSQINAVLSCVVPGLRISSGARRSACAVMQLPSCLVVLGFRNRTFLHVLDTRTPRDQLRIKEFDSVIDAITHPAVRRTAMYTCSVLPVMAGHS